MVIFYIVLPSDLNERVHMLNVGCFENEDLRKRRPKMGLRNYENEDPLRKRRPIFVFVVRKRRP